MVGGSYLAFEAAEKIAEKILHDHQHTDKLLDSIDDPAELEALQVKGAIRTDFILSAEIMAITLANLEQSDARDDGRRPGRGRLRHHHRRLWRRRPDREARRHRPAPGRRSRPTRHFGNALVRIVPKLLTLISGLGTAAMLWVGGGILVHGFEELHILTFIPETDPRPRPSRPAEASGGMAGIAEWLVNALGGAVVGLVIGGIIAAIVRQLTAHPGRVGGRVTCPQSKCSRR